MKRVERIKVNLKERSYEILIGSDLFLNKKSLLHTPVVSKKAVLVYDERLVSQKEKVSAHLKNSGCEVIEVPVLAGESLKSFQKLYSIFGHLINNKVDRHSCIFALGGGTVGDAAGFLAATYLRGVSWVGLPTTLLAQVDSSVGGKTGINHEQGKNLIGAFHQPAQVICDISFLKTLSRREVVSGLGEVIKYGLIQDKKMYRYLVQNWSRAEQLENEVAQEVVKKSLKIKAQFVAKDEFDRKGIREALNFGHTFGHALEAITDYRVYQHGEAVIWGQKFAVIVSLLKKHLKQKTADEVLAFLDQLQLPPLPKDLSFESVISAMKKDKKVINGSVRFVLLKDIGKYVLDKSVSEKTLQEAFQLLTAGVTKNGRE